MKKLLHVAIVNDAFGVSGLFKDRSDQFTYEHYSKDTKEFDILVFTGGADINSKLYGEDPVHTYGINHRRDEIEVNAYKSAPKHVLKAGICRGAQLLNVLNGGKLWQDVNNHSGTHIAKDLRTGKMIRLSSAHHQMMRPVGNFELIATADRATVYKAQGTEHRGTQQDPEVVWFPETNSLCFQAHPEFGPQECEEYFFDLIKEKLNNGHHSKAA